MIPQDPVMLLSFINLKLRDFYGSLKQLCDDLDVKEQEITDKLAAIDYHYDESVCIIRAVPIPQEKREPDA